MIGAEKFPPILQDLILDFLRLFVSPRFVKPVRKVIHGTKRTRIGIAENPSTVLHHLLLSPEGLLESPLDRECACNVVQNDESIGVVVTAAELPQLFKHFRLLSLALYCLTCARRGVLPRKCHKCTCDEAWYVFCQ